MEQTTKEWLEHVIKVIEDQQYNNYAGYLNNFVPWKELKSYLSQLEA